MTSRGGRYSVCSNSISSSVKPISPSSFPICGVSNQLSPTVHIWHMIPDVVPQTRGLYPGEWPFVNPQFQIFQHRIGCSFIEKMDALYSSIVSEHVWNDSPYSWGERSS